jgi:hypothetical protein
MTLYEQKLDMVCKKILQLSGTAGGRALKSVVMDLEGSGPIGEMLHSLDRNNFDMVIDLLVEFRNTGRQELFNTLHRKARERITQPSPSQLNSGGVNDTY